ncbi:hypothetical protein P9279_22190 [Mesorhizobium sp. WSM4962]|uniref:hypothetical protein n=1 Tax=Mesorhizobium sp. WSM4962 TaxID=3038548 RepID=UPI002415FAB6|nr:hypothetical protein [Mesorhizobium sp. WSM4962]MDG4903224.1 hypothetical protein [Mesorhizobium sp. WSM4962]
MILSSAAQMLNGNAAPALPWLPSGAIAFLDFVDGHYYSGGQSREIEDLLGGGFDAGSLLAPGLYFDNPPFNANRPIAIGPLFDDIVAGLAAGCTFVFEIDFRSPPFGSFIHILDNPSYNAADFWVSAYVDADVYVENQGVIGFEGSNGGFSSDAGIKRIAFTFARHDGGNYEYAGSTEGTAAATQVDTTAPFTAIDTITIGHDGDDEEILDDAYIRSITLYPAKLPADLPALSA